MKHPWKIVQMPKPDKGWYIEENEGNGNEGWYYFGEGKDGLEAAERAIGQWVRAYERGIKKGKQLQKRRKK